jgi:TfoX/Sxy family transcriptional regulator of competence genes
MEFQDYLCDMLKETGVVKAKKMFGTYNITMDGSNLGVVCQNKWYLKKTAAGEDFFRQMGKTMNTGIRDESFILTDFSDKDFICMLARITCDDIKSRKK